MARHILMGDYFKGAIQLRVILRKLVACFTNGAVSAEPG
jgi:hypothetical protein